MLCRDCPMLGNYYSFGSYNKFGFTCTLMDEVVFQISFDEAKLLGISRLLWPTMFEMWKDEWGKTRAFWEPYLTIPCICTQADLTMELEYHQDWQRELTEKAIEAVKKATYQGVKVARIKQLKETL